MVISRVFFDCYMGYSFEGLKSIALESMKKKSLPENSMILFVNRAQTAFKVLINGQYIIYHRVERGAFSLDAVQYFPKFFNGNSIDFDSAVKHSLERKMISKGVKLEVAN